MKFDAKEGRYVSDTDEEIDPGTDFIALCDETVIGWIEFTVKANNPSHPGLAVRRITCPRRDDSRQRRYVGAS